MRDQIEATGGLAGQPGGRWRALLMTGLMVLSVATLATITVLVRSYAHDDPITSDEAGFLLVGEQWHRGSSLYGDYWVDRPPGLIGVFWLAAHQGGLPALRWLGTATSAVTVLAAAWAVLPLHRSKRHGVAVVAAGLAAALLTSRYFQAEQVNGELLGLPWLMVGIGCLLRGIEGRRRRSAWWWLLAGGCAAAAISIKQNLIDVVVVAALLWFGIVLVRLKRRARWSRIGARWSRFRTGTHPDPSAELSRSQGPGPILLAASFAAGGLGLTGALLAFANRLGTTPGELWDAVVVFRADASKIILQSTPRQTLEQADSLLSAFWASGAPIVLLLLMVLPWRRSRPPVEWRSRPPVESLSRPAPHAAVEPAAVKPAPTEPATTEPATTEPPPTHRPSLLEPVPDQWPEEAQWTAEDGAALPAPDSLAPGVREAAIETPGVRLLRSPYWSMSILLLLVWEGFAVSAGGSYWWHYLLCLMPGLVLLIGTAAARQRSGLIVAPVVVAVAITTTLGTVQQVRQSMAENEARALLVAYLDEHRSPNDEIVVAFGDPRLVYDSDMASPYPYLWSLPVRVRDPELHEFQAVLQGNRPPDWIVVRGTSLAGYGVKNHDTAAIMNSDYDRVYATHGWTVLRRDVPAGAPPGSVILPTKPHLLPPS